MTHDELVRDMQTKAWANYQESRWTQHPQLLVMELDTLRSEISALKRRVYDLENFTGAPKP